MTYPILVYVGLPFLSPSLIVAVALCLLALRAIAARRGAFGDRWLRPLMAAAIALLALAVIDPEAAAKAYPVVVSLAVAFVFGASLIWPPTIIESLARLTEPDLSPAGVAYTRIVTRIWTVFLCGNAAVAAAIGVWGSTAQWALWNGLVSYLLMGSLFIGEFIVRRFFRSRA
jgi:uncharacterized membrane protein